MTQVKGALAFRKEDPKKWLFVVKQETDQQIFEKGIACAVDLTVSGEEKPRLFLLTCTEVTNQEENLSGHRTKPWGRPRPPPFVISNICKDDIFSFSPLENYSKKTLPLLRKDDTEDSLRSFIIDGDSFITVHWAYNDQERKHVLESSKKFPRHKLLGSPVLWTDKKDKISRVIGVIVASQEGEPLPKFLTETSLQIPVVPMPITLMDLPNSKVKEDNVTLKWTRPEDQREPIGSYKVYQRTLEKDRSATEWILLETIVDISVCEHQAVNLERGRKYEFTVTATNRHGEGSKRNLVQVKVLKGVPDPVTLENLPEEITMPEKDVTLKWNEPNCNGATITHYTLYKRIVNKGRAGGSWTKTKHTDLGVLEHPFPLTKGKIYEFMATATNSCGESVKEMNFQKVNVLDVPNPVKLSALPKEIDRRKLTLKWTKPDDNGADVKHFTVYKRFLKQSTWEVVANSGLEGVCEYLIELERGKTYDFCITATNKCGESKKESFRTVHVCEDRPMPVKLINVDPIVDKCDMVLKWREPQDNGAPITRYHVYRRIAKRGGTPQSWTKIHSASGRVFEYHVFHLERGTEYDFKVTAENKIGEGRDEESHSKRVKVREDVPEPVELIDLPDEIDGSELALKWIEPRSNGAPISRYTVYKRIAPNRPGHPDPLWEKIPVPIAVGPKYEHLIKLDKGKAYEFKMTATNRRGEGLKGRQIFRKVNVPDVPSPVILADKSRVKINSNKITLKWTEPENNGAAIFAYKVYKRTVNEDGEKFEWDFVSQTSAPRSVITLERGETFDLIVTAKNKSGESFKREDNAKRVEVLEDRLEHFGVLFLLFLGIVALWCLWSAVL